MTAAPIFPAQPDELLRIMANAERDRAPVVHEATVDEFLRICCGEVGS